MCSFRFKADVVHVIKKETKSLCVWYIHACVCMKRVCVWIHTYVCMKPVCVGDPHVCMKLVCVWGYPCMCVHEACMCGSIGVCGGVVWMHVCA